MYTHYLGNDPDFWSNDWMKAKARAALALIKDPNLAPIYHERTHVIQQRILGSRLQANLTRRYALKDFFKHREIVHYYFAAPFEKEAVYRTYKMMFK